MGTTRTINTFNEGMAQDVDKLNQPNAAYRYSKNGKLIFNEDGTYSWENEEGTQLSFVINPNSTIVGGGEAFTPLGYASGPNYIILFSKNTTSGNSEIGMITLDENGAGKYKTLFNDANDPNGDLFNFDVEIEATLLPEVDEIIRVYWHDGVLTNSNRPGAFTFSYDGVGPKNDVDSYSPVTLSVHNAKMQAEHQMGIIKYQKNINGNLVSGVYQHTYRLGTVDGYRTPWIPLTRPLFLTVDAVSSSNWHDYEMEGTGLETSKGFRFEVKGIDERFQILEVAYAYITSSEAITSSGIFLSADITGSTMTVDHITNNGAIPILDSSAFAQRYSNIERVKTSNIKDNTMYFGNIKEATLDFDIEPVLNNLSVKPIFESMLDDEKTPKEFIKHDETTTPSQDYDLPLTHQAPRTGTTTIQMHDQAGGEEVYTIDNDYVNYKGTQVAHLKTGYRRGETYRFGIVFFDKLGQPTFTYHLADIKFPELYSGLYEATRVREDGSLDYPAKQTISAAYITNNFGALSTSNVVLDGTDPDLDDTCHIRIMGIRFDGIDLTTIREDIVGYEIVRAELDNTILYQGLAMPCLIQNSATRLQVGPTQKWKGWDGDTLVAPTPSADDIGYFSYNMWEDNNTTNTQPNNAGKTVDQYRLRPYYTAMLYPELAFAIRDTANGPSIFPNDRLKIVGTYFAEVNPSDTTQGTGQFYTLHANFDTTVNDGKVDQHTIQKLYYTAQYNDADGGNSIFASYGSKAQPVYKHRHSGYYNIAEGVLGDTTTDLIQDVSFRFHVANAYLENPWFSDNKEYYGMASHNVIYYKTDGYFGGNNPADLATTPAVGFYIGSGNALSRGLSNDSGATYNQIDSSHNSFNIVNYVRENSSPYGGPSNTSVQGTVYKGTGHFQPVNNSEFTCPDIINGMKVWGGDTYITFIDIARIIPNFTKKNDQEEQSINTTPYPVGQGVVLPIESSINMSLRQRASEQNPSYANNGFRSQGAYDGDSDWTGEISYPDGIYWFDSSNRLTEEWNYQSALLFDEATNFYAQKPFNANVTTRFPVRWRYSDQKFYGDDVDAFRTFLVNDFRDMDGRYGEIMASSYLFDQIYVLQEEALSRLRAYERALVQSSNLGSLATGTGERLAGQDYISTVYGTQHQMSLVNSGKAIYWIDSKKRKFCRFAQNGVELLSDIRGMHQFFDKMLVQYDNADSPINQKGIASGYDYTNNTVYVSFTGAGKYDTGLETPPDEFPILRVHPPEDEYTTISFNENLNAFISFHDFIPNMYMSHKGFLLSVDTYLPANTRLEKIFRRGSFYVHEKGNRGFYYVNSFDSEVDVITKENMMYHKTFDNIRMNINDASASIFTELIMTTENQTETLDIQNDDRAILKENIFRLPLRGVEQAGRMRGKHITNKFIFDNENDVLVRFTSLETLFRLSNRL